MRRILPFLSAFVCCIPLIAGDVSRSGWTDKNNAQMSAAYMLQLAYYERGYMGVHVAVNRNRGRDIYTVKSGPVYHFKDVSITGLAGDDFKAAMQDAPKAGDVYSAARVNAWIANIEGRLVGQHKRGIQRGQELDRATASVNISVRFE